MSSTGNKVSSGQDKASLVQRKVEQGIELAKQDAAAVTSFGSQAIKSTAYLYPMTAHERYFQLKKYDKAQRERFVEERSAAYTSFGMMSIAMSLIPLFGPALMFTTAAGAALWAAELERTSNSEPGQQGEVGGKDLVEEVHPGQIDYD
ncbi:hypothetical protein BMF94_1207 [Rhodotorula taiwanensis]|uniref:Uncharacterized protein n=1 Tax=Rhodotorula taiwanensis TaxID=741276 RepID=A0A2S5BFN7_9BASI|nr:hypothetical protein BMF94_1207 [Rhodotorula taiwanensis]